MTFSPRVPRVRSESGYFESLRGGATTLELLLDLDRGADRRHVTRHVPETRQWFV